MRSNSSIEEIQFGARLLPIKIKDCIETNRRIQHSNPRLGKSYIGILKMGFDAQKPMLSTFKNEVDEIYHVVNSQINPDKETQAVHLSYFPLHQLQKNPLLPFAPILVILILNNTGLNSSSLLIKEMEHFQSLKRLVLSHNNFVLFPSTLVSLSSLKFLDLRYTV